MKVPSFYEGVAVALISSFVGSVLYFSLSSLFSDSFLIRLLISIIGFVYILYLLSRSQERIGKPIIIVLWPLLSLSLWLIWPPITLFVLLHIVAIWLIRSLYFYSSILSSLADLTLNLFSVAVAIWAAHHTGSIFLSIWCFFLVQALFVAIPDNLQHRSKMKQTKAEDRFHRAYKTAQSAIQKLSSNA